MLLAVVRRACAAAAAQRHYVMRPETSIHDNIVYAFSVDCEGRRLVLHTAFRDREPQEFTDVNFRDVVAHHSG